jgi:glyoxylase-like metal-dependent hydrolase (beta-lactamase superfamily II)
MDPLKFEAAPGITLDLIDLPLRMEGYHDFFGIWLLRDEPRRRTLVVDTGPASTVPVLLDALVQRNVRKLDLVLLTHIHLDHSGGLAEVLQAFPSASVAVHPRGKPHLADPSRLWESSLEVIPEMALAYGQPSPVDESAFLPEGAGIPGISSVDSPGHAPHHRSFLYETGTGGILFAGEAASTYSSMEQLRPGSGDGRYLLRPASPPKFYIDTALESIEKLKTLDASIMCYAHFGYTREVDRMLREAGEQIMLWRKLFGEYLGRKGQKGADHADIDALMDFVLQRDPWLEGFPDLPEDIRSREMGFFASSAAGFLEAVAAEKR